MSGGWISRVQALRAVSTPIATIFLVVSNLVPLAGVLFWGWDVGLILIGYWLENGIVGLLNIPKIMLAGRDNSSAAAVIAGFFAIHYGGFWLGHGIFVFFLVGMAHGGPFGFLSGSGFGGGPGAGIDLDAVLFMALLLSISHSVSFVTNYVGRGEYINTTPYKQMFAPYGRLVVLHVTIILGAFAVIGLGQPAALVAVLVVLKTALDLFLHQREHTTANQPTIV